MGTGDLQYNLYILEKEGLISFKRYGQYKHFYPNKTLGEKQKDVLSILSQEAPRDILLFLTQTPGTKQKDVARYIKTSSPTARWYLRKLEALGLIWSRKHGREVDDFLMGADGNDTLDGGADRDKCLKGETLANCP